MVPIIAYSDSLSDSPRFRSQLQVQEANMDDLEQRVDKALRLSHAASGKEGE